jgi:hypothetical protein
MPGNEATVEKNELGRNPKVNSILQKLNKKSTAGYERDVSFSSAQVAEQQQPTQVVVETRCVVKSEELVSKSQSGGGGQANVSKRFKQLQPPEKMESELDRVFKVCFFFRMILIS